jgi:CheY-like chemotaxis protein
VTEVAPEWLERLAHDLKNPISVIAGYAELMRIRDDAELRRDALEMILAATGELSRVIQAVLAPAGVTAAQRALLTPLAAGGAGRAIVIADDDQLMRRLIRETLPHDGYVVHDADDGRAALELVRRHDPVLLLLDLDLPKRSGVEVLSELRNTHPELSVIVVTAEPDHERREHALLLGAWTVVEKPFSPLSLLATIHASLAS